MTGPARDPDQPAGDDGAYWRITRVVTAALLAVWFVATFGVTYFARELSFSFFGWPFSFWMAAQGALLVYLALIGVYAAVMSRLDREHGQQGAVRD